MANHTLAPGRIVFYVVEDADEGFASFPSIVTSVHGADATLNVISERNFGPLIHSGVQRKSKVPHGSLKQGHTFMWPDEV